MQPEERARLAESQMLNDESLTDNLNDAEAQQLLNWAVIHARRLAAKTAFMAEADGDAYFEMAIPVLRRVIRKISKIGSGLPASSTELVLPELETMLHSAMQLPGLLAAPSGEFETLAAELASMPPSDAVTKLTMLLTLEE